MKLRKTRIRKVTKANGSVEYFAEYKWGFWWYSFADMMGPDSYARSVCYDWIKTKDTIKRSEQEVKELIDFYIARVKWKNACDIGNKVIKEEYEKYP